MSYANCNHSGLAVEVQRLNGFGIEIKIPKHTMSTLVQGSSTIIPEEETMHSFNPNLRRTGSRITSYEGLFGDIRVMSPGRHKAANWMVL